MGWLDFAKRAFGGLIGQQAQIDGRLDDLEILAGNIEFLPDNRLNYYWFKVKEYSGSGWWHGYRVVKLAELTFMPLYLRASTSMVQRTASLLRGIWAAGVELITLSLGVFEPAIGVIQCYGVGTRATTREAAVKLAEEGQAALVANFGAQYPQSRLEPLTLDRACGLFEARAAMPHLTTLIGQPDPRETARGTARQKSRVRPSDEYTEQQNEILYRAMAQAREEFLLINIATPVARGDLIRAQTALGDLTSPIASRQQGTSSIGFGVSLPVMLSVAQGLSAGQTYGTSQSQGISDAVGVSHGSAHTDGTASTSSWSHSTGQAHAVGVANTDSVTHTTGTAHSVSVSNGTSTANGTAVTNGTSHTDGSSTTHGETTTTSTSMSSGVADSQGASLGASLGGSMGATVQPEVAATQIGSLNGSINGSVNASQNWGHTDSSGISTSIGTTVSDSTTSSHADTTSHAVTNSHSEAVSHAVGVTNSTMESTSVGHAVTNSTSDSTSSSDSTGGAFSRTSSDSVSQSTSASHGVSQGQGLSMARTLGAMQSSGLGAGVAPSASVSKSFQWKDENAVAITELLEEQMHILAEAVEEGGFFSDVYILTRTEKGRRTAEAAAVQAFGGSKHVVTHIQPRRPASAAENAHLRRHLQCLTPSTLTETLGWLNGYAFATLVTPTQQAAYSAPGLFEEGTALTTQESTPPFAFEPELPGDLVLGHLYSVERGEQTNAQLRLSEDLHFHTAFAADTGFGKTVAAERLAFEVVQQWHHRAIVLDFGAGWRKLLNTPLPPGRTDIYQLYPGAARPLRWNLLQIGRRIHPENQYRTTAQLICSAGRMGPRQYGLLQRALCQLYLEAGVLTFDVSGPLVTGSKPVEKRWQVVQADEIEIIGRARREQGEPINCPVVLSGQLLSALRPWEIQALRVYRSRRVDMESLYSLLEMMRDAADPRSTDATSLEGLLLRLQPLTTGEMARMYRGGEETMGVEDLGLLGPEANPADRWGLCILEGGAQMDEYSKVVILSLATWHLYNDAVVRRQETLGGFNRPMDIFWEEANKILGGVDSEGDISTSSSSGAQQIWQQLWRDGRKYKAFQHPIVQTLETLPAGILSSCNNAFFGQLKGIKDRDLAIAHLARSEKGFTDEEYKRYISRIPRELAIVKLGYTSDVAAMEPMLARPLMVMCEEPTDEDIAARFSR